MEKQAEILNNEGVILFLNGQFSEAEIRYREALKIYPEYVTALNNLGLVLLQEKKYDEAEKLFIKAIGLKKNENYFLNLGHVYANKNIPDKAEIFYMKCLEINPRSLMALKSLATIFRFQKKYAYSVKIWKEIVENHSSNVYYKNQLKKDLILLEQEKNNRKSYS